MYRELVALPDRCLDKHAQICDGNYGTIVVTIKDENSATTTITVTHPTTLGDENTVEQPLLLIPGKRYPFTVAYTGTAHHYKLVQKTNIWPSDRRIFRA